MTNEIKQFIGYMASHNTELQVHADVIALGKAINKVECDKALAAFTGKIKPAEGTKVPIEGMPDKLRTDEMRAFHASAVKSLK